LSAGKSCLPVAAIILAAGAGTRMGKPKQLLPYRGRTLIEHAIEQACEAEFDPILVVVGAHSDEVRAAIAARPVEIVQNDFWQSGMGSSLSVAARRLREIGGDSAAVAVLLADQPRVMAEHLSGMRRLLSTSAAPIIAARYNNTIGVPALFKRELFATLAELAPDVGARQLLRDSGTKVTRYLLPEAAIDVDTPGDYAALQAGAT
jgi:CTP:molybdopterin cytidylyltransferase MocA